MTVPSFKLSELPLRRTNVTVPSVVGVHFIDEACPPLNESPSEGMLKGFDCCASAKSGALSRANAVETEKYIVKAFLVQMRV